jgi:uncharacterized membrane protein (UPF0127 family)
MWLMCGGSVLAAAEEPRSVVGRIRGLLGRDGLDGALVLRPCKNVHTAGMRFSIDVAFCDRHGIVLRTCTLRPWRVSPLVTRSTMVIEAQAGAFERWGLKIGDRIEVRE